MSEGGGGDVCGSLTHPESPQNKSVSRANCRSFWYVLVVMGMGILQSRGASFIRQGLAHQKKRSVVTDAFNLVPILSHLLKVLMHNFTTKTVTL